MEPENYYGLKGLPSPAREYIEYYTKNPDGCVGLSCVDGVWRTIHASGRSKSVSRVWSFIPTRYISFNRKGICLKW